VHLRCLPRLAERCFFSPLFFLSGEMGAGMCVRSAAYLPSPEVVVDTRRLHMVEQHPPLPFFPGFLGDDFLAPLPCSSCSSGFPPGYQVKGPAFLFFFLPSVLLDPTSSQALDTDHPLPRSSPQNVKLRPICSRLMGRMRSTYHYAFHARKEALFSSAPAGSRNRRRLFLRRRMLSFLVMEGHSSPFPRSAGSALRSER